MSQRDSFVFRFKTSKLPWTKFPMGGSSSSPRREGASPPSTRGVGSLTLPDSHLAENHRFCHAGVGYRRSFSCSTRNSQLFSFLSPKFELVPFPHLHPAVFFHFCSSLTSLWLQKGMVYGLGRSDLESQTNSRNRTDFEILTYSFESHGYPHFCLLFVES
jgi:hypothetical protein